MRWRKGICRCCVGSDLTGGLLEGKVCKIFFERDVIVVFASTRILLKGIKFLCVFYENHVNMQDIKGPLNFKTCLYDLLTR